MASVRVKRIFAVGSETHTTQRIQVEGGLADRGPFRSLDSNLIGDLGMTGPGSLTWIPDGEGGEGGVVVEVVVCDYDDNKITLCGPTWHYAWDRTEFQEAYGVKPQVGHRYFLPRAIPLPDPEPKVRPVRYEQADCRPWVICPRCERAQTETHMDGHGRRRTECSGCRVPFADPIPLADLLAETEGE